MWHDLAPVSRAAASRGPIRQPFGTAEGECHAWFGEECTDRGLTLEHDENGDLLQDRGFTPSRTRTSWCESIVRLRRSTWLAHGGPWLSVGRDMLMATR
jgi:hypothetical protein